MSEQALNMIISRIEEMGYKLGGEAIQLLQQYYPIVRRKVLISNLVYSLGAIMILSIAILLLYLAWKDFKEDNTSINTAGFFFTGIWIALFGGIFFFNAIIKLLNLDYYTIMRILDNIQNF